VMPSAGMMTTLDAVSTIPRAEAVGGWWPVRSRMASSAM
jgi:hypothetical protein